MSLWTRVRLPPIPSRYPKITPTYTSSEVEVGVTIWVDLYKSNQY